MDQNSGLRLNDCDSLKVIANVCFIMNFRGSKVPILEEGEQDVWYFSRKHASTEYYTSLPLAQQLNIITSIFPVKNRKHKEGDWLVQKHIYIYKISGRAKNPEALNKDQP